MTTEIHGFCDEPFAGMRDAFAANFADGFELGSSLALTHKGRTVVDLWAGDASPSGRRKWEENTICPIFSGTKLLMSIATLIEVDRGLIDLDAPVAHYWPEFAQGGKQNVRVRDVLGHCAGVPGVDPRPPWEVAKDWDAITARLAAEPHWFGGERRVAYHSSTFGYLLGEIIRRVDGRRPRQFCTEEITSKAGIDLSIGISREEEFARVARLQLPQGERPPAASPMEERIMAGFSGAPDLREGAMLEGPSGNGFSNGRALARLCAIPANDGTFEGVRFFSPELAQQIAVENSAGDCPIFGYIRFGLGFAIESPHFAGPSDTSYWWGGFGGTRGLVDPAKRISMGYVPNNLRPFSDDAPLESREARLTAALATVLRSL